MRLSGQSDELPCMTEPVRLQGACRSLLGEPQGLKLDCGNGFREGRALSVIGFVQSRSHEWIRPQGGQSIGNGTTESSSAEVRNARAVAGQALPGARCPPCAVTKRDHRDSRRPRNHPQCRPSTIRPHREDPKETGPSGVGDGTFSTSQTCQVVTTFDRPTRSTQDGCHA